MAKLTLVFLLFSFISHFDRIYCVEQICELENGSWYINGYDGARKEYYQCKFNSVQLLDEKENLIIKTSSNAKPYSDVTLIYYEFGVIKYIPNTLFSLFPNVEYFLAGTSKMDNIKPHYFRNALKLKVIRIHNSDIKVLTAHSFKEANNLEHLRLDKAGIENIHKLAFSGLLKLKRVHLDDNKIKNLHPDTFSHLVSLQVLILTEGTNCLKEKFTSVSTQIKEIEKKTRISCSYDLSIEIETNLNDFQESTIKMFEDQKQAIAYLTAKNQALEGYAESTKTDIQAMKNDILTMKAAFRKNLEEVEKDCQSNIKKAEHSAMESFKDILILIEDQALIDKDIISMNLKIAQTCDHS